MLCRTETFAVEHVMSAVACSQHTLSELFSILGLNLICHLLKDYFEQMTMFFHLSKLVVSLGGTRQNSGPGQLKRI